MELQLALSLSSYSSSSCSSHEFDLNDCHHEDVERNDVSMCMKMEDLNKKKRKKKQCANVLETFPLLFCNKSNQECDVNEVESTLVFISQKNHGEENDVIGWPPVKSSRKKHFRHKNHGGNGGGGSKSMYVKVHMEGDGIARKIDLNLHHSYHTLGHTLAHMFGKCSEDVKLTYQDKEGDWLLAGDVPWRSFTETVQRLKLRKSNC